MKKTGLYALSFLVWVGSACLNARADVLVDLRDADTISIMKTQLNHRFTVKIAEPIESKLSKIANSSTPSNKAIKSCLIIMMYQPPPIRLQLGPR
jgi:hypothetical protein